MKEIKTNRINGYLDLDSYFIKRLGRKCIDLEDLYINGLIEYETNGLSEKFWILSDDNGEKLALFKQEYPNSNEAYAELFSEEVAKVLEIPVAHYDLATFNDNTGVISYNFLDDYNNYYSGFDIICDFYEKKLEENEDLSKLYNINYLEDSIEDVSCKLNNLQDIWIILEDRFKNKTGKEYIVKRIINRLVDKLIFDALMINIDDHADNWAVIDDVKEGYILAPLFDNTRSMNMHNDIQKNNKELASLEKSKLQFRVDDEEINQPLEVLKHFLTISSSEYRDLVIDKVNTLQENAEFIPERIENRIESKIPEYLKEYFVTNMYAHLDKVNQVINGNTKGSNK